MTFLLDNLTAVIVGAILISTLFVLQQRSQQGAIEAVQRHQAQAHASALATTIEREFENARSRPETEDAFAVAPGGMRFGEDTFRLRLQRATTADGTEYTSQVSFPTLSDPENLAASPVYIVTYVVQETGETARVDGRERALLTATRYEFPRGGPLVETATYARLVDFDVTAFQVDGTGVTEAAMMARTPARIHSELRYAPSLVADRTSDQRKDEVTSTRLARTARVVAAMSVTELMLADLGIPGGIPLLPGDIGFVTGSQPVAYAPGGDGGGGEGEAGGSDAPPGNDAPGDDGTPGDSPAGSGSGPNVLICHQATNTKVSQAALGDHLGHGDLLGSCPGV